MGFDCYIYRVEDNIVKERVWLGQGLVATSIFEASQGLKIPLTFSDIGFKVYLLPKEIIPEFYLWTCETYFAGSLSEAEFTEFFAKSGVFQVVIDY